MLIQIVRIVKCLHLVTLYFAYTRQFFSHAFQLCSFLSERPSSTGRDSSGSCAVLTFKNRASYI